VTRAVLECWQLGLRTYARGVYCGPAMPVWGRSRSASCMTPALCRVTRWYALPQGYDRPRLYRCKSWEVCTAVYTANLAISKIQIFGIRIYTGIMIPIPILLRPIHMAHASGCCTAVHAVLLIHSYEAAAFIVQRTVKCCTNGVVYPDLQVRSRFIGL
jgi:hypothetical protein